MDYGICLLKHLTTVHSATRLKSPSYLGSLYTWILKEEIKYVRAGYKALSVQVYVSEHTIRIVFMDNNMDSIVGVLERKISTKRLARFTLANTKLRKI